MNNLQCVRDHIIRSCQSSERSQDGVVNVLKQKDSVEGVSHGSTNHLPWLWLFLAPRLTIHRLY